MTGRGTWEGVVSDKDSSQRVVEETPRGIRAPSEDRVPQPRPQGGAFGAIPATEANALGPASRRIALPETPGADAWAKMVSVREIKAE